MDRQAGRRQSAAMALVLHIEDDPHGRLLVRKLLEAAGHQVVETPSGLDGVRLATELKPDLVLVDINVLDLDGYEVTLRLRGTPGLEQIPIVATTAEGDRHTSLAVGADGYLPKPINAKSFGKQINRFLAGHREAREATGEIALREQSHRIVERLEAKVRELSEANRRLEELARLRREFLQNVSHELATPMTPVVGYLKLLLGEELGPLSPLQMKCLRSIERSTRRLRTVVETLLDVSALESGRLHYIIRDYDFGGLVSEAVARVSLDAPAEVALKVEPLPSALIGRGDPEKLRRAMVHVLDNAMKFTPRGGRVGVGVRVKDGEYQMLVLDDGPGIPEGERERIFAPFYQVDGSATRAHGGVGLGLAFARRVAESVGGSLDIQSPPDDTVSGRSGTGTLVRLRVRATP